MEPITAKQMAQGELAILAIELPKRAKGGNPEAVHEGLSRAKKIVSEHCLDNPFGDPKDMIMEAYGNGVEILLNRARYAAKEGSVSIVDLLLSDAKSYANHTGTTIPPEITSEILSSSYSNGIRYHLSRAETALRFGHGLIPSPQDSIEVAKTCAIVAGEDISGKIRKVYADARDFLLERIPKFIANKELENVMGAIDRAAYCSEALKQGLPAEEADAAAYFVRREGADRAFRLARKELDAARLTDRPDKVKDHVANSQRYIESGMAYAAWAGSDYTRTHQTLTSKLADLK